jgi:pantetheine-phosphate adenylyltransferase
MSGPMIAVYAGSFDPVTNGHLDVMKRAAHLFDRVVVAVGRHPTRAPLFNVEERLELLRDAMQGLQNLEVASFEGLVINYCAAIGAAVLIRGLRHGLDFEYELQIAQANADMSPEVETVFLPTSLKYGFLTASLVREIASHGGDVSRYVPPNVCRALADKLGRK